MKIKQEELITNYINFALDFCAKCYSKYNDFYPFAFVIKEDRVITIDPDNPNEIKNTTDLIETLTQKGKEELANNHIINFALAYKESNLINDMNYEALKITIFNQNEILNFHYPYKQEAEFKYLLDLAFQSK